MKTRLFHSVLLATLIATSFSISLAGTHKYSYDAIGRLTSIDYGAGRRMEFVYDPAGNLLRKTVIPFLDSDGDQIDDAWENIHLGGLTRDGTGDLDGDGQTDLHEFLAGTRPNDASSALRISSLGTDVTLTWQAVPGKRYRVLYKERLDGSPWVELPGQILATSTTATRSDATAANATSRYYRIVLDR
jgi:YD repeat-containing protein